MYKNRSLVCKKGVKASFNEYEAGELESVAEQHNMAPATFVKQATLMALRLTRLYGAAPMLAGAKAEKDIASLEMIKQLDRRKTTTCLAG